MDDLCCLQSEVLLEDEHLLQITADHACTAQDIHRCLLLLLCPNKCEMQAVTQKKNQVDETETDAALQVTEQDWLCTEAPVYLICISLWVIFVAEAWSLKGLAPWQVMVDSTNQQRMGEKELTIFRRIFSYFPAIHYQPKVTKI